MEPGHEDREYPDDIIPANLYDNASMEPGHEDREYAKIMVWASTCLDASMEPGHEDREYRCASRPSSSASTSLNGARS